MSLIKKFYRIVRKEDPVMIVGVLVFVAAFFLTGIFL